MFFFPGFHTILTLTLPPPRKGLASPLLSFFFSLLHLASLHLLPPLCVAVCLIGERRVCLSFHTARVPVVIAALANHSLPGLKSPEASNLQLLKTVLNRVNSSSTDTSHDAFLNTLLRRLLPRRRRSHPRCRAIKFRPRHLRAHRQAQPPCCRYSTLGPGRR